MQTETKVKKATKAKKAKSLAEIKNLLTGETVSENAATDAAITGETVTENTLLKVVDVKPSESAEIQALRSKIAKLELSLQTAIENELPTDILEAKIVELSAMLPENLTNTWFAQCVTKFGESFANDVQNALVNKAEKERLINLLAKEQAKIDKVTEPVTDEISDLAQSIEAKADFINKGYAGESAPAIQAQIDHLKEKLFVANEKLAMLRKATLLEAIPEKAEVLPGKRENGKQERLMQQSEKLIDAALAKGALFPRESEMEKALNETHGSYHAVWNKIKKLPKYAKYF